MVPGLTSYRDVQTATADPARLVIVLLDGTVRFLTQAQRALERDDGITFVQSVARANRVILHLASTLDYEAGGDIAVDLARLYDFMFHHLVEAMSKKSEANVAEVLRVIRTIRDGFETAIASARS